MISHMNRRGCKAGLSQRNCLNRIRYFRTNLIDNATLSELKFRKALDQTEIPYEFQKIIKCSHYTYKIVDFFLFGYDIVIEIDGSHHFSPEGQYKDNKRTQDLESTSRVKNIIRFTNHYVLDSTEEQLINEINDYITGMAG